MSNEPSGAISWKFNIPLINNRFVLTQTGGAILTLMVFTMTVFGALLTVVNGWDGLRQAALICLAVGAFFVLVSIFTFIVVFGNSASLEFHVCEPGIEILTLERAALVSHRLAFIAGMISGNPGMAGIGLSGMAREIERIAWENITRYRLHPALNVIAIKQGWMPARYIYCTPDNFEVAANYIRERAGKTPG